MPAGGIDRIHFSGESYTLVSNSDNWSGYFSARKSVTTPYNVTIDNVYDATTKEVLSTVKVMLTAASNDSLSLTMVLTESKIISDQEEPDTSTGLNVIVPDYEHNHLVRTFYTPALGKQLTGSKVPGRVFIYRVKRKLDDKWKPENCTIVAYVHSVGTKKEV
ncbi:MAG: Omp28-related outer membrane protein, partial [Bacteroidetes bacterium]|nr:Omp28-related outer membrane protein [Bacteroidota bacterium]